MLTFFDRYAFAIGGLIGLTLAAILFFTVPAYHAYIIWQFHQPVLFVLAVAFGALVAVATD